MSGPVWRSEAHMLKARCETYEREISRLTRERDEAVEAANLARHERTIERKRSERAESSRDEAVALLRDDLKRAEADCHLGGDYHDSAYGRESARTCRYCVRRAFLARVDGGAK